MIKSLIVLLYTVIKVYILLIIVGGIVLYYLSPQFKELVVESHPYKDLLNFVNQVRIINLNVPISNKERAVSYLGRILVTL